MAGATDSTASALPVVRETVRKLLLASPAFLELEPPQRRELAAAMVTVCERAAALVRAEAESDAELRAARPALAAAQSAGSEFSGVAASRVAGTTRAILNAVSFPRFVTELINGVFRAMIDSNRQQMHGFVELLNNVSASTEGFADANLGDDRAREWLAEQYPGSFEIQGEAEEDRDPDEPSGLTLRLRPGAAPPSAPALRAGLGLSLEEDVPAGDPERTLLPLARRALARQRQQVLATMVMLGMQRIVIESGRIHASMRFHIDTHSAAQQDRGSQFDFRNTLNAAGSFGYGPWGASATMSNTVGYVSTEKTQTAEELNTSLDLNSSVELVFKTDYLPLERLAGKEQTDRIKVNTLNPVEELKADAAAREKREQRIAASSKEGRSSIEIKPPPVIEPPKLPDVPKPQAVKKAAAPKAKSAKTKAASPPAATKAAAAGAAGAGNAAPQTHAFENAAVESDGPRLPDVIYAPTPEEAVPEMLALAGVRASDLVYELGCGDARVIIAAAQQRGCRAVGWDLDPERVADSRRNVQRGHVGHLVRIEQGDLFTVDLRTADVVFLYLLPQLNVRLIPQLARMKPGARIVSQDFDMAGILPDRVVQVFLEGRGFAKTFYLWTTPLRRTVHAVRHEWSNAKGIETAAAVAC